MGSGCGAVGRAVASNSRGLGFKSSHWQLILNIFTVCRKDENKRKEAGIVPFLKYVWNNGINTLLLRHLQLPTTRANLVLLLFSITSLFKYYYLYVIIFLYYFWVDFLSIVLFKTVDFRGIRTRIVGIEGEHADHNHGPGPNLFRAYKLYRQKQLSVTSFG